MPNMVGSFRALHLNKTPLRLPNAWDAGSARLIESLGAAAIATTSAGMAWSLGYRDGRVMPPDEVIAAASRIMRVLKVPLSIDIENGYSDDPKKVVDTVMRLVDLGIAGINIEDGNDTPTTLARKIEAIKSGLAKADSNLFVNARCNVFLANLVDKPQVVDESVGRGRLYASAGADGLFLPGILQPQHIQAVTSQLSLALNVMAVPGLADAAEIGEWGVRRLSAGSGIAQILWREAEARAREFLESGQSGIVASDGMPYGKLQGLFSIS